MPKTDYRIRSTHQTAPFTPTAKQPDEAGRRRGYVTIGGNFYYGHVARTCMGETIFWPKDIDDVVNALKEANVGKTVRVTNGYNPNRTLTFTQRGNDPEAGFVRVKGKTISGFVTGNTFWPWSTGKNQQLLAEAA